MKWLKTHHVVMVPEYVGRGLRAVLDEAGQIDGRACVDVQVWAAEHHSLRLYKDTRTANERHVHCFKGIEVFIPSLDGIMSG